jgi:hypothetical protein
MKHPISILSGLFLFFQFLYGHSSGSSEITDPTGTYLTHFNNENKAKLPQGTIKVKLIKPNKIIVSLIMQNGEPSFRSDRLWIH